MNNKGFAISGMLYSILILFLILIMSILATLGARKLILDKTKNDVINDIISETNKEQLAAYKIINDHSGTANFAADTKNTAVNANLAYTSKYYFKGSNPNNYLQFAGVCWRIVSISHNNTIKIIYENNTCSPTTTSGRVNSNQKWSNTAQNNWYSSDTALRLLLETYANSGNLTAFTISSTNLAKVNNATWYVGSLYYDTKYSLYENINQERAEQGKTNLPALVDKEATEYTWQNKIGLLSPSEFVKASSSALCYNTYTSFASTNCKNDNYLYKEYNWWTLNANSNTTNLAWFNRINQDSVGDLTVGTVTNPLSVRPVLYLNNNVNITGKGTPSNPYVVS